MHQRACLKQLTGWRRAFRQIKYAPSRIQAVSQLVKFADEQKQALGAPIQDVPDTAVAEKRFFPPTYVRVADRVPKESVPDFAGVIEGKHQAPPAPVIAFEKVPVAEPTPIPAALTTWPDEATVLVYGMAPNFRLLLAEMPDGRKVSVWRGPRNWRLPSRIQVKRDPNSSQGTPIYSPV